MTSFRLEIRTPGSPAWLRFVSFVGEDEAYARAIELREDTRLYAQVRVIECSEKVLDTFGKDYEL